MEFWEYIHQPWLYVTLSLTYFLSIVTVIVVILGENRNPVKSLAWVTILILLPAVGLILYFFFGRNIKNKRMISRRNKRRLRKAVQLSAGQMKRPKGIPGQSEQLAKLATALAGSPYYTDNQIDVYSDGKSKFDALKADLLSAEKYIHLQYYIFEDDKIGHEIAEILIDKAKAGVKIRVIYDHVGSFHVNSHFFRRLREAGVEAYPFFKVAFIPFASKVNWRNHRKMVIIDGKTGYIGGMNIADRYVDGGKKFKLWRDCHLRVCGPAIAALYYSFARDWNFMGRELLDEGSPSPSTAGNAGIQLVTGGPMSQWNSLAQIFAKAISIATKRVWIQTPYFLPPEYLTTALQNAALGGVDVRIMIPRHGDSKLLGLASRSYFTELIRAGVKFYMFESGMLHSKLMIVDDNISTVGSTNFDFRSFEHNFEGNLIIYSREFNENLQQVFLNDQAQATRIHSVAWKKRPFTQKASESILRLLSPIL